MHSRFYPVVLLVPVVASSVFLTGCATETNNMMQSWVGHHQSELIASWGPPLQVASDGKGSSEGQPLKGR